MKRFTLMLLLCACTRDERVEAESLSVAVRRFHEADNARKPAAAEALRAVACSAPEVCSVRAKCVLAADAYAEAMRLTDEVIHGLDRLADGSIPKDSDEARALVTKREKAEERLQQAEELLPKCDEDVFALRRKHRL